jgi:hypothetical protein
MVRCLPLFLMLAMAVSGCKTITEELPTTANEPNGAPVINVPVPLRVTPVTIPQAAPTPAPTSQNPTPNQAPVIEDDGDGEDIPDNQSPVQRVTAKVFFVECGGGAVPGSENATQAAVGCRVHLDTTAKDAGGRPTQPRGNPQWTYSDRSSFSVGGRNPFTPVLTITAPGSVRIHSTIDGVSSNEIGISFR